MNTPLTRDGRLSIRDMQVDDDDRLLCPQCGKPLMVDVFTVTRDVAYRDCYGNIDLSDTELSRNDERWEDKLICPACGWEHGVD